MCRYCTALVSVLQRAYAGNATRLCQYRGELVLIRHRTFASMAAHLCLSTVHLCLYRKARVPVPHHAAAGTAALHC